MIQPADPYIDPHGLDGWNYVDDGWGCEGDALIREFLARSESALRSAVSGNTNSLFEIDAEASNYLALVSDANLRMYNSCSTMF